MFEITDSISLLVIGLFKLSISSWVRFDSLCLETCPFLLGCQTFWRITVHSIFFWFFVFLWYQLLFLFFNFLFYLFGSCLFSSRRYHILYIVWGSVLTSVIYISLFSFPNTTCRRDYLFSIVLASLLEINWPWVCGFIPGLSLLLHRRICLFWGNAMLFWVLWLCSIKVWEGIPLALFFIFS